MAWQDVVERVEGMGWLGAGVAAVVVAPALIPAIGRGLRPAVKGVIKGYLVVTDKTREVLAESSEQWQDLVAEAKAEREHQTNGSEMMTMELPASNSREGAEAGGSEAKSRHRVVRKEDEPKPEAA